MRERASEQERECLCVGNLFQMLQCNANQKMLRTLSIEEVECLFSRNLASAKCRKDATMCRHIKSAVPVFLCFQLSS